ncbi:Plastid ribosomal protein L24 [Pleodorina starrii]|uniref:Plastid ribosomal protein L24 n=1 Tax=Pleodorina starrii TaxID=330485 RepID=A0A9W6BHG0_9CHLO|nr:Plastid ribosomal protein L24 [Pleodorina starrii]GLC52232.1 Plastid ribosomal protein L24 [Pleodorina starrii]GLC67588.1 Plastid ribosomal protein L24 [Pleodorina starrii]
MASLLGARAPAFFGSRVATGRTAAPRRLAPTTTHVVAAYGDLPKIGGGRKWEHLELGPSGKALRVDMHVKKGDTVQVIAGKDKGKVGTIVKVLPKKGKVVVEGVNQGQKHIKPRTENESGQIKTQEFPIHHSNVMLYSKEKNVRSRVGHKVLESGKKVRYLIKTGEIVD